MDEPWFVRQRSAMSYQIAPCRWQGWAVTAAYVVTTLAITPLAMREQWLAWGTSLAVATFAFCLIAWRTSDPA